MTVKIDGASPPALNASGTSTPITTASFTPSAGSLLVMFAVMGWSTTLGSMSCSDSGGHTWITKGSAYGTTSNGGGVAAFYTFFDTSPGAITASIAFSGFGTGGGHLVMPALFIGAAKDQSTSAIVTATRAATTDGTLSVAATRIGSYVWGICDAATNNTPWTANANTTLASDDANTTDNIHNVGWAAIGPVATLGNYAFGGTWTAAQDTNLLAFEIVPPSILPQSLYVATQAVRSAYL